MEKNEFKVLVADDDESVRDVVADVINREGFPVEVAVDGTDALNKILHGHYHLIITDLKMPGASGLEILKSALSLDADSSVIIITAYATLQSALEAVKEGAYDYVTKPFRLDEMLVTVGNAFKRSQLLEQNRYLLDKLRGVDRSADTLGSLERLVKLRETGAIDEEEFSSLKDQILRESEERKK